MGMTYQKLRTRLSWLESYGLIQCMSTNKFTLITICDYDRYRLPTNQQQGVTNKIASLQVDLLGVTS